ncbi:hypothetical protein PISMIDRAFT_18802 [Pisolithus microcarpus 441]|uniref:Uncharacterized protein n=1 Tax=Pisolithus microcarpus 441 TaxID=765257 RepID=A0A0C9XJ53_9AGAM|nr:hypothetical protein PISMIDRAFT_18802 [Pisolithus microcarpus 441]
MDMDHMPGLSRKHDTPRRYGIRDFLCARTTQMQETIIACHLYYIPSRSSCYHEFLLVHTEGFIFIVERVPTNSGMRVVSSNGGAARDTITVVRAREHHEYWQSAGRDPVCKGTLRWHQSSPRLFDIAFIASLASTTFKHYNLYVRQCYFYARITLDAMATAFPSCSRHGTTSFSKGRFAMLGSYKLSHVQLLVDLHAIGCQAVAPAIETERRASRLLTPDFLHGLAVSIASFQRSLVRLMSLEPSADTAIRHGNHTSGGIPAAGRYVESHQVDDHHEGALEVGAS